MANNNSPSLFSKDVWNEWVEIEKENYLLKKKGGKNIRTYLKKGYDHFDHRIWFPDRINKIHSLVSDLTNLKQHTFLPFLKTVIKTPRFKYEESVDKAVRSVKKRPICFASHFDSLVYGYFAYSLNKIYQQYITQVGFDESILAYRTDLNSKCNIQFAKEVFENIKARGDCTALTFDIKGFFDNIDHTILKEKWAKVIGEEQLPEDQYILYKRLTKYSYVNKTSLLKHFKINLKNRARDEIRWQTTLDLISEEVGGTNFKTKFKWMRDHNFIVTNPRHEILPNGKKRYYGIPQGSAMSAVLSNIYLVDFDQKLFERGQQENFLYRRYCDDLLIVCPTENASEIENIITNEIAKYKVRINDDKTDKIIFQRNSKQRFRAFDKGKVEEEDALITSENEESYYKNIQYLGFEFDGERIFIRPSSLSRYFRKMKARICKTIGMAYSKNSKSDKIFKKQLYSRYSHLGKRNFLTYAYNAASKVYKNSRGEEKEGLDSPSIRRQIANHFRTLQNELKKESRQRARLKSKGGISIPVKE